MLFNLPETSSRGRTVTRYVTRTPALAHTLALLADSNARIRTHARADTQQDHCMRDIILFPSARDLANDISPFCRDSHALLKAKVQDPKPPRSIGKG